MSSLVSHDSFICVTWLVHMCDVTRSHVRWDSFIHGTSLIHMWDVIHSYVECDSFTLTGDVQETHPSFVMDAMGRPGTFCMKHTYGVATISRLLKMVGLFCKRVLCKRWYSAKETYNIKEPTNRFHPILQPIAFWVSFNRILQSQSLWSLFNGTSLKRPRKLDHRLRFQNDEMTLQMQYAVYIHMIRWSYDHCIYHIHMLYISYTYVIAHKNIRGTQKHMTPIKLHVPVSLWMWFGKSRYIVYVLKWDAHKNLRGTQKYEKHTIAHRDLKSKKNRANRASSKAWADCR